MKKDRERYQLERFRAVFPMFPAGTIIDGKDDGSEPDFFVVEGQRLIVGIELTELYRTPEPNQQPRQAGMFDRAPDAISHVYHSAFSRTFFFNWFEQTSVELKTQNNVQSG